MAKYERRLKGDFDELLAFIDDGILRGSVSASFEEGSFYEEKGIRCAVRVYERYSWFGKNRVSLHIVVLGNGNNLFVSAITSGGSQAMFMKINTVGEESFLDNAINVIESYRQHE